MSSSEHHTPGVHAAMSKTFSDHSPHSIPKSLPAYTNILKGTLGMYFKWDLGILCLGLKHGCI